jgi:hypothetical protein
MARAARWDGILLYALPSAAGGSLTPDVVAAVRAWIAARRSLDGYEIVVEGVTPAGDPAAAAAETDRWARAGATWWIESDWEDGTVDALGRRIAAGPPAQGD